MSVDNFWYDVMGHGPLWVPTHFLAFGSKYELWGHQWITVDYGGGFMDYVILSAPLTWSMNYNFGLIDD